MHNHCGVYKATIIFPSDIINTSLRFYKYKHAFADRDK